MIRNLTPHPVNLIHDDGVIVLPAELPTPRSRETAREVARITVNGQQFPIVELQPGPVTDLPAETEGMLLIVSRVVASALPHRHDLVVPYDFVRDADGNIKACKAFARLTQTESA